MELKELKEQLKKCAESRIFCKIQFRFEYSEKNLLPVAVGEECFISAEEDNFALDGFVIHRIADIDTLRTFENGFAQKALLSGTITLTDAPELQLDSFEDMLKSLLPVNTVAVIERFDRDTGFTGFYMGKIVNAGPRGCMLCKIDINGSWDRIPEGIPAEEIKRISFGKKAQELYSKLLPYCPIK